MEKIIRVTREITFDVLVTYELEDNGDGNGGYSSTGNSMTGSTGKYYVVSSVEVDDIQSVVEQVQESINADDSEFSEADLSM